MNDDTKVLAGRITMSIILSLSIISIIYKILHLNFATFNSFIELIDDASAFMTLICLSFGLFAIMSLPQNKSLLSLSIVDIVIVNRLYSNKRIKSIFDYLIHLNKSVLIFGGIIILAIAALVHLIIKTTKAKKIREADRDLAKDSEMDLLRQDSTEEREMVGNKVKQNKIEDNVDEMESEEKSDQDQNKWYVIAKHVLIFILCSISLLGIMDYILFNYLPINIERPAILANAPGNVYYASMICVGFLVVYIVLGFVWRWRRNNTMREKIQLSHFSVTALLAAIFEAILIFNIANNGGTNLNVIDYFLSAVSDNLFAYIVVEMQLAAMYNIIYGVHYSCAWPYTMEAGYRDVGNIADVFIIAGW